MKITMSRVRKVVEHDITKQVLQFIVTPSNENAIVKIKKANFSGDYELWGEVDETGSIDRILDFGTYDYVVSAVNYESSMGRVTLSNSKTTFVEKVSLKPNFGFVVVDDAYGIAVVGCSGDSGLVIGEECCHIDCRSADIGTVGGVGADDVVFALAELAVAVDDDTRS